MSAYNEIQSAAETAIQELEVEIADLEEQIEAQKLRIQNARVQIQALQSFLNPGKTPQVNPVSNDTVNEAILETLNELCPQSVHYKDLTDLVCQKGIEITGKQPEKVVLSCLIKMVKAGKAKNSGKGYYEIISGKTDACA